jgi:hypothetical protein
VYALDYRIHGEYQVLSGLRADDGRVVSRSDDDAHAARRERPREPIDELELGRGGAPGRTPQRSPRPSRPRPPEAA